jgi:uncharacterized protein YraI
METTRMSEGTTGLEEAPPPPPELDALTRPGKGTRRSMAIPGDNQTTLGTLPGILENRFILSALGIVVVLLLTAIVLVVIGHGDDDLGAVPSVSGGSTPEDKKTPVLPAGALAGTATTTMTLRYGPDTTFPILGTIPRGAVVAVVGRSEDRAWLQVRYPPNSNLKGWVTARMLRVDGDITKLAIAGPGPAAEAATTAVPTYAYEEPVSDYVPEVPEPLDEPTVAPRATRPPTARPTRTPYIEPTPPEPTVDQPPTLTPQAGPNG